ncbi:MAG TPA: GNAT family N-acetyltransferase [Trebonia sp.]|nr:GNAT family N-acetyltransferase [Trebonia sp.]
MLLLDGRAAAGHEDDLLALRADVCGDGGTGDGDRVTGDGEAARRLRVWRRQPGFALAEARHGGYLVGYACGMPLRPSTSWWRGLTTPLPDDVTAEHPGRTFALTGLMVRAAWRRQGIGTALHDRILAGRPEERATLTAAPTGTSPAATAAQGALRAWGWTRVARTRDPDAGPAVLDVLVLPLPVQPRTW